MIIYSMPLHSIVTQPFKAISIPDLTFPNSFCDSYIDFFLRKCIWDI